MREEATLLYHSFIHSFIHSVIHSVSLRYQILHHDALFLLSFSPFYPSLVRIASVAKSIIVNRNTQYAGNLFLHDRKRMHASKQANPNQIKRHFVASMFSPQPHPVRSRLAKSSSLS